MEMTLTRRDMLKMSLLGSAALMLPLERVARTQLQVERLAESQLPKRFVAPFVRPPLAVPVHTDDTTDYYEMTMKQGYPEIIPGLKTEVWGYEGHTPGPTIRVQRGRNVVVRHRNEIWNPLHEHTSVHLHGNASLPQYDGYANDTTNPGEFKDYHYPNFQDARTLWYHDHGVHVTGFNAYMGCAAFYITHDEREQSLTDPADGTYKDVGTAIPGGDYDVPLVLRDAIFGTDGSLIFDDQGHSSLFGDVILVNGAPWPLMKVERRKYRFRILNASISRGFNLKLSSGDPLTVIGHDGGLAPEPVAVNSMRIGMAERYEVVIDFSRYNPGETVDLNNLGLPNIVDFASTNKVMRFEVVDSPVDTTPLPAELNPNTPVMNLTPAPGMKTRNFRFERTLIGGQEMWTINGNVWDPNRVDANPGLGDTEIWEFENKSGGWFHPVHIHLVDFKILDRNGRPPHPWERGPKDVVYIGQGETVRMIMKFAPQKGKYMIHCHNLVHEDHDMMTQFEVGSDGPAWSSDPAKPTSQAGPLWEDNGGGGEQTTPDTTTPGNTTPENTTPNPPANTAPVISVLRPTPNMKTRDLTPTIAASIKDAQTKIAKSGVQLFIDGRKIGKFAYSQTTGKLVYTCKTLRPGRHAVKVVATDPQGRSANKTWTFRVIR
ncbi:MAG TPA: multicopper oxidase domain-containing protein [Rubrobacteraceae bacterium]|nr:multicopper oxidase domain-containing protein [Rubrobacteraceae bacterium]